MTLSEMRKNKELTQEDLANLLEIDRSNISKWETGDAFPNPQNLQNLAEIFNCSIDDVFKAIKQNTS